jgi:hypothetical protein
MALLAQYPDSPPVEVLQYKRGGTRVLACEDWSTGVEVLGTLHESSDNSSAVKS